MKRWTRIIALALFAVVELPVQVAAQEHKVDRQRSHHHYKLIDIATFGGPKSDLNTGNDGTFSVDLVNNQGALAGWADTATPDPFPDFCFDDCYVARAFRWQDGAMTDLGALAGGVSSQAVWISASGLIAGNSQNGQIDPLFPGFPELRGVLWRNGVITDVGTLDGGTESIATAVNSHGQVVGQYTNTIPDPYSLFGLGYQTRGFSWQDGVMQDLGTLGSGTDASPQFVNERGQVAGWSYTNSTPSAVCAGSGGALTTGSFIWGKETGMTDVGTLGGTCTLAAGLNNKGMVIGQSFMTGDQVAHAFIWDRATGIADLGTLGGDFSGAEGINDRGDTSGWANSAGNTAYHATLWRHAGKITDLGVLREDQCSFASAMNAQAQIVGASITDDCNFDNNTRAVLWEDGSILDLNALIPNNSPLHLQWARGINDRGEIAGSGLDADGNVHAFLVIPCDERHPGIEGCDYNMVEASAVVAQTGPAVRNASSRTLPQSLLRRMNRYRFPGLGASNRD